METIFACFILGSVAIVLFNLLPGSILAIHRGAQQMQAEATARSALEEYRAKPFTALVEGTYPQPDVVLDGVTYHSNVTVFRIPTRDWAHLKGLRSVVSWRQRNHDISLEREVWRSSVRK